jgi:anti-sigma factor RsiW
MSKGNVIDALDLVAYADDQLEPERRIAVEHWLSQHPSEAAGIMADLRLRGELRMALVADEVSVLDETELLAARLGGKLQRQQLFRNARPVFAACVLVLLGWLAHDQVGYSSAWASSAVPDYVSAAVDAHHTTELRASMTSQVQATEYDPDELMAGTGLKLPQLPSSWTVSDVQVYPSRHGPSVEIAVHTTEFGLISIFAARPGPFLVMPPRTRDVEDTTTAYWQVGDMAYAIVATGHQDNVGAAATRLFELLR